MSEVFDRLKAALADRYAIEREIGAGGMATVYLARDLKHDRKVAIKVLRPELGAVLGAERFLSEITVTANLQHPNLLPLFDSGEADGQLFYVMPYVEGESLRRRIDRVKQLPIADAIHIATSVASALDYAHRQGIVHRDLKPENILLRDGEPLVADFGISLAVSNAGGDRVTQTGLSLGTPQYMSPEQAMGDRTVDGRADIYSLAALTYEMLAGEPPHSGTTSAAIIARVLTERPRPIRVTRPSIPKHVGDSLEQGLEKLPADRFATAKEFAEALNGRIVLDRRPETSALLGRGESRRGELIARVALIVLGLLLGGGGVLLASRASTGGETAAQIAPTMTEVTFAGDVALNVSPLNPAFELSRDGSLLAFRGSSAEGSGIFVRRMDEMEAHLIRGANGWEPRFSPNGDSIIYYDGSLGVMKIAVTGGTPFRVATSGRQGLSWGDDGTIAYTRSGSIWRLSENGDSTLVATPDSARGHIAYRWPHVLPGGDAALIAIWKNGGAVENAEIGLVRFSDGEVTELGLAGTGPRFLQTGHILFVRADGVAQVVPFSLRDVRVTGPAVSVLKDVRVKAEGETDITVSSNGTLVYRAGLASDVTRLVAVDRRGQATTLVEGKGFAFPRVSPDGRRIALNVGQDIWTYDLEAKTLTPLTRNKLSTRAEWTPDGSRVAYQVGTTDKSGIDWQSWDGGTPSEGYVPNTDPPTFEISFGPAGSYVALRRGAGTAADIWIAPSDSIGALRPFLATDATEDEVRVSPDGRLVAYRSYESKRKEIYVRPLPNGSPRIQVSSDGGEEPVWSRDGRELFFRGVSRLIAATIVRDELKVAKRDTVVADRFALAPNAHANYDVLPDGRLLMVESVGSSDDGRLVAITNWFSILRAQANGGR